MQSIRLNIASCRSNVSSTCTSIDLCIYTQVLFDTFPLPEFATFFTTHPPSPSSQMQGIHTFTPISPNALIGPNSKYDRNCSSLHEYTNPIIAAAFAEIFELASSPT